MKCRGIWIVIGLCVVLTGAYSAQLVGAVSTAPPPAVPRNASIDLATRIDHLPFTSSESTGGAPSTANGVFCGGNDHAVWFVLTVRADTTIDADTLSSDYDTTLSAYTGPPSALKLIACNDDAFGIGQQSEILFDAKAGQTVYLMAASYSGTSGGNLQLSVTSTTNNYPHRTRCQHRNPRLLMNQCAAATPYYLAAGDSAPMWNGGRSYPDDLLRSSVTRRVQGLKLVKTACSSETSQTFINFSLCGGSQLQKDVDFLTANRGHVALVTIDIGGNDAIRCVDVSGVNWTCASEVLKGVDTNLSIILSYLRAAAGPNVPIVGMNYYNPYLNYWLLGPSARPLVMQTVFGQQLLNQQLARTYAKFGVPVANVQDAVRSTDMTTMVASKWGRVPVAVQQACTLLNITCPPVVVRLENDPNVAGAAIIAEQFELTIRRTYSRLNPPA